VPFAACFWEHVCCKDEVVKDRDNLGGSVGGIGGIGNIDEFFDLIEEGFGRLVGVVRLFHCSIVVLYIGGSEVAVGSVEMDQHLSCGDIGQSCDAMVKGSQVELVDGADDVLLEGFVSSDIGVGWRSWRP
jgi:hypothetical protein